MRGIQVSLSPYDPITPITYLYAVISPDTPVILAGGSDGTIEVFRICGVKSTLPGAQEAAERKLVDLLNPPRVESKKKEEHSSDDEPQQVRLSKLLQTLAAVEGPAGDGKSSGAALPKGAAGSGSGGESALGEVLSKLPLLLR